MNNLEKRIIDICYENKISHIGSAITAVNVIDEIYSFKEDKDIFVLSSGHAGLALYAILEKYHGFDALKLYKKHGLHPHRDLDYKIYCSTGSLGSGICVGVGMALADKDRDIYVLISDGECAEGSVWESLSFIDEQKLDNIFVYVNLNGFGAYKEIDRERLKEKLYSFLPSINIIETDFANIPFLSGLSAHYKTITKEEYDALQQ